MSMRIDAEEARRRVDAGLPIGTGWLAALCGMSRASVDRWLTRGIRLPGGERWYPEYVTTPGGHRLVSAESVLRIMGELRQPRR